MWSQYQRLSLQVLVLVLCIPLALIVISQLFNLTIHEEHYCVLGEFWKEADGDLLLLRPGEETVWYYAHEQDKVKFLRNTMYELLEKELVNYLREN